MERAVTNKPSGHVNGLPLTGTLEDILSLLQTYVDFMQCQPVRTANVIIDMNHGALVSSNRQQLRPCKPSAPRTATTFDLQNLCRS